MRKEITISVTPADRVRLEAIATVHKSTSGAPGLSCRRRMAKAPTPSPRPSARTKPRCGAGRSALCTKRSRGCEREVPADKAVHVVLDNYATHKHPKVSAWLARHQRFTFHFTRLPAPGPMRLRACLPSSPDTGSNAASSHRSSSFRPPSTASSPKPTTCPSRSSGPNPPTPSSPPCSAGGKR